MSIKVYEAYRLKEGIDPFDLLAEFKQRGQALARERLAKIFYDILDGRSEESARRLLEQEALFQTWVRKQGASEATLKLYALWSKEHCPEELRPLEGVLPVSNKEILNTDKPGRGKPDVFSIDAWMLNRYGETQKDLNVSRWALDTSITIRKYEDHYYIIPYCDRRCLLGGLLSFLAEDNRLEDYVYWNNADKPEDVSLEEWRERGNVWNELTEIDRWPSYLVLDIVSWTGWHEVTPMIEVAQTRKNAI